jgi:hypothetical protein
LHAGGQFVIGNGRFQGVKVPGLLKRLFIQVANQ